MQKFFVTSALPYPNNSSPHLGNLVGALLSGDVYARFKRNQGHEVIYLCGTDEYGTTTMIRARKEGVTCRELCDKYFELHKKVYDWFNIEFDVFGRTSTTKQTEITWEIFNGLYNNGYIEEKTTVQAFCEKCDMYLADTYLKGYCYHDGCRENRVISNGDQCEICQKMIDVNKLINPFCSICLTPPIQKSTDHLYLSLDKLTPLVQQYLDRVEFDSRIMAISKAWLEIGLNPRCITRDLEWGTPIPIKLDPKLEKYADKVFYVWFDAPIGYYSILANKRDDWREWLNSGVTWVSTQAKDNVPFHSIVFPASVLGSNVELPLIDRICGTDYLLYEGQKFSKSQGVGLFGDKVSEISPKLGINEDYWRFYLMKIRPETQDSSFNLEEFVRIVKTDLVNNIGNFINRVFSLLEKTTYRDLNYQISPEYIEFIKKYEVSMDEFKFRDSLKICLEMSSRGNKFVQSTKPWTMIKDGLDTQEIMTEAVGICWILLNLLKPIIPKSACDMLSNLDTDNQNIFCLIGGSNINIRILDIIKLPFKNIDLKQLSELIEGKI